MGRAAGTNRPGWRLVVTEAFARDVEAQLAWLAQQDLPAWQERLRARLDDARQLLLGAPFTGVADGSGLRRLLLRELPFFLWYQPDEARRRVVWLRLFHVRQRAPARLTRAARRTR